MTKFALCFNSKLLVPSFKEKFTGNLELRTGIPSESNAINRILLTPTAISLLTTITEPLEVSGDTSFSLVEFEVQLMIKKTAIKKNIIPITW